MKEFREEMLQVAKAHFEAHIHKHRMNIEVFLNNTVGVAEHPDIMETIEKELSEMAHYHDLLEALETYF